MNVTQVMAGVTAVLEIFSGASANGDWPVVEETTVEESVEADASSEPEILDFVDVYGEHYQVEIDPDVPKHPYDYENLIKDGEFYSYEDENYTSVPGIDVSKYQGNVDWEAVAAAGAKFVFLRMGYRSYGSGELNLDPMIYTNLTGAQAAGLDVGVYFFSQAINEEEAREEACYVLQNLEGYELQMPIVYDPETIRDDNARTDDVTGAQFTANAKAFCEEIRDANQTPMVYCNMLWEAFQLDLNQLTDYDIWYADYEPLPQTPYDYSIWQYSQTAHCPGVSGAVDKDLWLIPKEER